MKTTIYFGALITLFTFLSCADYEFPAEDIEQTNSSSNMNEWYVDPSFSYRTEHKIDFTIEICDNSGEALNKVPYKIYSLDEMKGERNFLVSGMSNSNGHFQTRLILDKNIDTLLLEINYPGFPSKQLIPIISDIINYKIDPHITPITSGLWDDKETQGVLSRSIQTPLGLEFNYIGTFKGNGAPNYLEPEDDVVGQEILDLVAASLPEEQSVPDFNPQYISSGNVASLIIEESVDLWITFVHEGADYQNAVGYYSYPTSAPPSTFEEIESFNIIFPNTSFLGSGGGLRTGNKVYLGEFSSGISVGWFLIPDGWNNSQKIVEEVDGEDAKFSNSNLNTFTSSDFLSHCVVLEDATEELLYLSFEDINRPGGDNDFNDAVFYINATPYSALNTTSLPQVQSGIPDEDGDGVPDSADEFLNDPEIAFSSYVPGEGVFGTLVYEDMWPSTGDYDMNDMVIDYNFAEYRNTNNLVVKTRATIVIKAMGAGLRNGFGFQTDLSTSQVESVTGTELYEDFILLDPNGVETSQTNAVFIAFDNGFKAMGNPIGFVNTELGGTTVTPDTIVLDIKYTNPISAGQIGAPPYNPFIFTGLRRGYEVHLADMPGTDLADVSIYQTMADDTDPSIEKYYKTANNLPWAIHFTTGFDYPKEKKNLKVAYNFYSDWVLSSGSNYPDWYYNNPGYRRFEDIY